MPKNICFVSLGSYPVLAKKNMGFVGGAEVQQVLLGEELLKHNFEVSFITYTDGQVRLEYINGIKLIKVYKRGDAPTLSPLAKAWHIWSAMREANADIYFFEAGAAGVVSIFSRLRKKKFIHYIPSDHNVSKKSSFPGCKWYHKLAERLDIKLAHVVIVQSEFQRKMLKENFGRESRVIKNAFPFFNQKMREKVNPPIVLWVSTIGEVKQPELFLRLAEAIPEGSFQMVGGVGGNPALYCKVEEASDRISNLELVGFVPFHKIDKFFERASIFVNTSKFEGFPNTYIQAWSQYLPTVSLNVDPDGLICKNRLGFHSRTFDQLVYDIELLLKDEALRKQMGKNAREYAEKEHDINEVVKKYIEVFTRL